MCLRAVAVSLDSAMDQNDEEEAMAWQEKRLEEQELVRRFGSEEVDCSELERVEHWSRCARTESRLAETQLEMVRA